MSKDITLGGKEYTGVPYVSLPKTGGGSASFTDVTDTTAAASDVASGKYFYTADGIRTAGTASGGGGIGTLLATKSLGHISTSSTSSQDTGQKVSVPGIDNYDLLIVEASVDSPVSGRHVCTLRYIQLTNTTDVSTKSTATVAGAVINYKRTSDGVDTSRATTVGYGVFAYSCSISNGAGSITMYQRYNSTQSGTINGDYTVRVYGLNMYGLI